MPTCFVITGYGIKKDYIHNRDIDLDKSYKYIIKPVFEELGYVCKRSSDYPPGVIDSIMYKGIYNADFVLADISTLNPNALYELGVRHALKPYSTLIICENGILIDGKLPFDLNHITALPYQHDGKTVDVEVADEFKKVLKKAVTDMVEANEVDSPVFTHLRGLSILIKDETGNPVNVNTLGATNAGAAIAATGPSFSEMIDKAVAAIDNKNFQEAIEGFNELLKLKPNEPYFIQQLCLATYKSKQKDPIAANTINAYNEAYEILQKLNPMVSTDPETLGMAGSIHKTLYNLTNERTCLEKSLRFYERGYYIANDYYNGINTAFLYWKLASLATSRDETMFYKMQAIHIAKNVVEICKDLQKLEGYEKNKDKKWIINTLAEAYYGLDDMDNFNKLMEERKKEQTDFSEDVFMKQYEEFKLIKQKVADILK